MIRNVAGQKFSVFAFNRLTNEPVTGDAANITAKLSIDYGARIALTDVNPTEAEDGNYDFDATQAETNGHNLKLYPKSTTPNVQVIAKLSIITVDNTEIDKIPKVDEPLIYSDADEAYEITITRP